MKSRSIIGLTAVMLLGAPAVANGAESRDISEMLAMDLEDLIDMKVVTGARREQKISESPSSISVVTAEDIKQLGATQLSEALRMVAGIHFGFVTHGEVTVAGIRGYQDVLTNRLLLMIDGIPWMFEPHSNPLLHVFPLAMEEIERIEVLKGPGSSLYGGNAVLGIINVISKKPKDTHGSLVSLTAGELNTFVNTFMHGGSVGEKVDYRVSASHDRRDHWKAFPGTQQPVKQIGKFNTFIDYTVNDNSQISFMGSYIDAARFYNFTPNVRSLALIDTDMFLASISYLAKKPNIMVRYFWSQKQPGRSVQQGVDALYGKMGTSGVEFQHTFNPLEKSTLTWGANFTHSHMYKADTGLRRHDTRGIFVDHSYEFNDQFTLFTGIRHDHHPNVGDNYPHRVSLLYTPVANHHLRFTWAESFRTPDFLESYEMRGDLSGSEDNDAVVARSFELAYTGQPTAQLNLKSSFFYSKVKDAIDVVFFTPDDLRHVNVGDGNVAGTEFEVGYELTRWLNAVVNYTYFEMWEEEPAVREFLVTTPQHMANAQLRARFDNGFNSNLTMHYRDHTEWVGLKVKDYFITSLRIGYEFEIRDNDAEISLNAFNMFDKRYRDFTDTSIAGFDTRIGRRITANLTYKF